MRVSQLIVIGLNQHVPLFAGVSALMFFRLPPHARPFAIAALATKPVFSTLRELSVHHRDSDFWTWKFRDFNGLSDDLRGAAKIVIVSSIFAMGNQMRRSSQAFQPLTKPPSHTSVRVFPAQRSPLSDLQQRNIVEVKDQPKSVNAVHAKTLSRPIGRSEDEDFWGSDGMEEEKTLANVNTEQQGSQVVTPRAEGSTAKGETLFGTSFPEPCVGDTAVCKDGKIMTGFSEAHPKELP